MTDELKPCPGCNSHVGINHECTIGTPQYRIKCGVCGMQTGLGDKKHIIRVWNTRHNRCDLSSVDNLSLMAESVRRGLAEVQADDLPSWAKEAIEKEISILWDQYAKTGMIRLDACARKLECVLSLRRLDVVE